ncbi:hypothetical protein [Pontibacillus sp. HMF3514]|uniref:hypothetical protein n=1 Tax=Pontibacillus sp. HMF3514 TaxID=2692425 RepID=UPI00131F5FDE|nr:hypothetical protein [Pontibacillus sp. HMF3514]QHE51586.1 hypothetical protein GS400_05845 [Pontibacillus sp. HMF3514]QHE52839.1 hypothetical protein GS400_12765 [Pontibacillus sp. HMF3514]
MSYEKDIQKQFYKIYKELITVSEFEEWLYNTPEIEKVYGHDFYFNLLDLNYRSRHIKNELEKVIEIKIPFGEFEQMRIVSLLENIIYEKGDLVEVLEQVYDDYCKGYSFLRYLGLNYITGIDNLPKKREMLKNIKPKIVNEARRLLSFFQHGLLKITDENEYDDYRTEKEKVEINNIEKMFND